MEGHTHSLGRTTRTALARHNARDAVMAEEAGKAVLEGRQTGWGGGPDGVAGQVGWLAGSGGEPGTTVRWWASWEGGPDGRLAWSGGGPGGQRGMDLWSKDTECSGVNIVTWNIQPLT